MNYFIIFPHKSARKLLLKLMHYNIAFLHILHYFLSCEQDLLICPKSYIFVNRKGSFHTKSEMNKTQAEGSASESHSQIISTRGVWE